MSDIVSMPAHQILEELNDHMIEHNTGVSTSRTFALTCLHPSASARQERIGADYFSEE
ncbi:MAG: hypothetical protein H7067_15510 [Burkholderiales bacterium]|nr:hypothetical protein [Opitutaceae bacterium]